MSDLERQLAEVHAALDVSEAGAATLRKAIETYLGDVTIDASVLRRAVQETQAGAALLAELDDLRRAHALSLDALTHMLTERPRVSLRQKLQRWLLRRWEQFE